MGCLNTKPRDVSTTSPSFTPFRTSFADELPTPAVGAEPPTPKTIPAFEGHIPDVSPNEPWLHHTAYVQVPRSSSSSGCIVDIVRQALTVSKFDVVLQFSFSRYLCEMEAHFNANGVHSDARFRIYTCGKNHIITISQRQGEMSMQLFNDVCGYLVDNKIPLQTRDGAAYTREGQIKRPFAILNFEVNDETKNGILAESIKSAIEIIQSRYVDVSLQGLLSLVGIINATKNLELFLEYNIFQILRDKLYSRDEDLKLCAMTAVRAFSEGGENMHEAIVKEGIFFCLSDACIPSSNENCGVTPFSDAPYFHGRVDRSFAEMNIGAMHPGAFMVYIDQTRLDNNVATIICLESLRGDGRSHHMQKLMSYQEVVFRPETKTYHLSSESEAFPSLSALVGHYAARWTTPLMTSATKILVKRDALRALSNVCQTKSAVESIRNFNVVKRMTDVYTNESCDDVMRRAAWEGLRNVQKH